MQYEIKGTPLPVAICSINNGESLITERGSMSWMSSNIEMQTVGGSVGAALGRMFSGESLFQNKYTARKDGCFIAFASSFPGNIIPLDIRPGSSMIVQKRGFLAAEETVELSIAYKKKISSSLFGGEGFIMQKLSGSGTAFVEIDGSSEMYELSAGESMYIDTGYLAMMDESVTMEIEMVKGVKNMVFGGEGLFNTRVTGPGRVWIQTMPITQLVGSITPYLPAK